jgi:hypothetical protein
MSYTGKGRASASQRSIANSLISTTANKDCAAVSQSSCCCRLTSGMPTRLPAPRLKTIGSRISNESQLPISFGSRDLRQSSWLIQVSTAAALGQIHRQELARYDADDRTERLRNASERCNQR